MAKTTKATRSDLEMAKDAESEGKFIFYIPSDGSSWVEEMKGFRVAMVRAGEDGYRWTGEWPNDGRGVMPYFWGPTLEDALRICVEQNRRNHISASVADIIIMRSMARGAKPGRHGRKTNG